MEPIKVTIVLNIEFISKKVLMESDVLRLWIIRSKCLMADLDIQLMLRSNSSLIINNIREIAKS